MQLLILKTNINTKQQVAEVAPVFDPHPGILDWCVDVEDIDKVLRIEATDEFSARQVAVLLRELGYYCTDLPE